MEGATNTDQGILMSFFIQTPFGEKCDRKAFANLSGDKASDYCLHRF
ncbi:hypothetical protein H6H01_36135 [Nostoc calcicola FACHB-3891]|nr:hypothetical protein [Nostoc calcicola FACHB-3891]